MSLKKTYDLIPKIKRPGAVWSVAATVLLALLDFVGVAALVSILLLVLDDGLIMSNPSVAAVYDALGFASPAGLAMAISVAVLVVILIKSILSIVIVDRIRKYTLSLYRYYSSRMFDTYMSKGLLFIRGNHTSQLINNVNGVCMRFTDGVIGSILSIMSEVILLVIIMTVLFIISPLIALLAVAVFVPFALLYILVYRRRMAENGKMENQLMISQNKMIYETFKGYSDIEINQARGYVSGKFKEGLDKLSHYRRKASITRSLSGRLVEFSLVLGVVAMIIVGLWIGKPMESLKISLGIFAVAAYKIIPAVSHIINNWIEYKRNAYSADIISDTLADSPAPDSFVRNDRRLPFEKEIAFTEVSFGYGKDKPVLNDFSLRIEKGEKIGFCGPSGVGKSTLFNLICGFFRPEGGSITIDGEALTAENTAAWQNNLAYVSQDFFIPDVSIAENIAFGLSPDGIDRERLWNAIEAASLTEFIYSLSDGIETVAGEGGGKLSGGQRQRIGIARALYKNASVILMDEATSSLDDRTERDIVEAVKKLSAERKGLTLLIISHRESTLSFCDRIIKL